MATPEDVEMEKIAEDELAKLQRQYRVMELDRSLVMTSAQPTLRVQRNIIRTLNEDLDKIVMELKLTRSTSNVLENARTREKLLTLLKDHEKYAAEVRENRGNIRELDFLLQQVQKEIKGLKSKGVGVDKDLANLVTNQSVTCQLENRLDTAMKKFNSANSDNYRMRLEIDRLLRDRQFFNTMWGNQLKRLMQGKAQILELVEAAISTYDQREEWCNKLDALKEQAAIDYRKHCLEVRELQRQLDHSLKLEEFLRTKGTVRLTAADAKAEARKMQQKEDEMRAYNHHVNVLDAIKEFTGEEDVDRLVAEFTRREEENYALFNYINEVNTELKSLSDSVRVLSRNIEEENAKHQAKLQKQQDSIDSLRTKLDERKTATERVQEEFEKSDAVLKGLLDNIHALAVSSDCDSLPILKLLGKSISINVTNAKLYIKGLEKRVLEMVEVIKVDEALHRQPDSSRTPPSSRRRRASHSPRNRRASHSPRTASHSPRNLTARRETHPVSPRSPHLMPTVPTRA